MSKVLLYCVQKNEINKQKRNPSYDLSPIITHAIFIVLTVFVCLLAGLSVDDLTVLSSFSRLF